MKSTTSGIDPKVNEIALDGEFGDCIREVALPVQLEESREVVNQIFEFAV